MENKGFEAELSLEKTQSNLSDVAEKPLKVDINVLKARAQEAQNKENRKNISIFVCFILILGAIGVYLSI
tara:strand:- start:291 stop:500 length:210 start_codon:yes stop_codon:yes gene_type:complete